MVWGNIEVDLGKQEIEISGSMFPGMIVSLILPPITKFIVPKKKEITHLLQVNAADFKRVCMICVRRNQKELTFMIPYGRQTIEEDDIQAVVSVLKSDYLTTGPKIAEFEKIVADYVGAKYAVAISNGTSALHAACFAAGIQPGDEVITTPLTFAASSNCVLYCGGTPVFADVDPKNI